MNQMRGATTSGRQIRLCAGGSHVSPVTRLRHQIRAAWGERRATLKKANLEGQAMRRSTNSRQNQMIQMHSMMKKGSEGEGVVVFDDLRLVVVRHVDLVVFELRQSLQTEDDDGGDDHEDRNDGNIASAEGRSRIFKQKPNRLEDLILGQWFLLIFGRESLIGFQFIDR